MAANKGMKGPLTGRQLIRILLITGAIVAFILLDMHQHRELTHAHQAAACSLNAPAGWPCDLYPNGYPSGR